MKKNTLFKIIAILAIVLSILSWIIPASSASGTELTDLGLYRVSLYNLVEYPYLAFQYFATHFLYILAVGGLYGVLAETGKYRNKLEKIAKSMKGKEITTLVVFIATITTIALRLLNAPLYAYLIIPVISVVSAILNKYLNNKVGLILIPSGIVLIILHLLTKIEKLSLDSIKIFSISLDEIFGLYLAIIGLAIVLVGIGYFFTKYINKKENEAFLVTIAFVLTALSSVCGLNLLLFVFVPALCGIILLMGYDKITAFLTTIVSILIGTIGSTYGYYITGYVNAIISSEFTTEIVAKVGLFVLTFAVYALFLIKHAKSSKKAELTNEDEETLFLGEKKLSKKPSWPLYLVFGIFLVLLVLGYTNWSEVFAVDAFTNFHETITTWEICDHTVVSYLIDGLDEFGGWSYEQYTILILISSMILALIYNIKVSDALTSFGKGVKSVIKVAGLVVFAYILVIITAYHPYFVTITDWMTGFVADMSGVFGKIVYVLMVTLNTILSSVLNVEMLYVVQSGLPLVSATFADYTNSLAIITQSVYGLTMLVAPTSVMMIIGLTYLDIPYFEWLKKSWKLVLELLAIILIVIFVVVFL